MTFRRNTVMLLVAAVLVFVAGAASQSCYYPNGTSSTKHVPCNSTAEFSSCCAPGDECLTNGLCRNNGSAASSNDYWRNLCTDPTWASDACPKFCYNSSTSSTAANGTHFVAACSTNTYCCADLSPWRANHLYCCQDPLAVFDGGPAVRLSGAVVTTLLFPTSTTTSAAATSGTQSSQTTGSSSSTAAAAASASSTTTSSTSSSTTAIGAGVGVGVGVAVVLAVAGVVWYAWKRKQKQRRVTTQVEENKGHSSWQEPAPAYKDFTPTSQWAAPGSFGQTQQYQAQPTELDSAGERSELAETVRGRDPVELDGRDPVELSGATAAKKPAI